MAAAKEAKKHEQEVRPKDVVSTGGRAVASRRGRLLLPAVAAGAVKARQALGSSPFHAVVAVGTVQAVAWHGMVGAV